MLKHTTEYLAALRDFFIANDLTASAKKMFMDEKSLVASNYIGAVTDAIKLKDKARKKYVSFLEKETKLEQEFLTDYLQVLEEKAKQNYRQGVDKDYTSLTQEALSTLTFLQDYQSLTPIVVVDGSDSVGKNTQAKMLKDYVESKGGKALLISFPNYGNDSAHFVEEYLGGKFGELTKQNPALVSLFYSLDRALTFAQMPQDTFYDYDLIIFDRYTYSNAFYSTTHMDVDIAKQFTSILCNMEFEFLNIPHPDVVLYLDLPFEIQKKLLDKRAAEDNRPKDLHEANLKMLQMSHQRAHDLKDMLELEVIDCSSDTGDLLSREDIHDKIKEVLAENRISKISKLFKEGK